MNLPCQCNKGFPKQLNPKNSVGACFEMPWTTFIVVTDSKI